MGNDPAAFSSLAGNPELKEFAHILGPDPAHPAAKPILGDLNPLAAASSLVEDILLEYVDNKPMSEVGWGRVDESTLRRLIPLHTKQFAVATRTPLSARTQGSNLMAHILDTLEQAQHNKAVPGALGPVGARLAYFTCTGMWMASPTTLHQTPRSSSSCGRTRSQGNISCVSSIAHRPSISCAQVNPSPLPTHPLRSTSHLPAAPPVGRVPSPPLTEPHTLLSIPLTSSLTSYRRRSRRLTHNHAELHHEPT